MELVEPAPAVYACLPEDPCGMTDDDDDDSLCDTSFNGIG